MDRGVRVISSDLPTTWTGNYPLEHATLVTRFEAAVDEHPDRTALIYEGKHTSYRELEERSNRIANDILARGLSPEEPVALLLERSVEMLIAIFGVLKAGGAYVPLDPESPRNRLNAMVDDCGTRHIITTADLQFELDSSAARLIIGAEGSAHSGSESSQRPECRARPDHLAYILYTSGTTGTPKGVAVSHRSVVNRLCWGQEAFRLQPDDRHIQKTPYTFDVSVPEIFWPLSVGATLVIAKPGGHRDTDYLYALLKRQRINVAHFVPSMLRAFLRRTGTWELPDLRHVYCSGESLPPVLQSEFHRTLSNTRLFNLYGPTEAAVEVTCWECKAEQEHTSVPLGWPIANTQLFVVNPALDPVPAGQDGELCIAGVQLARGYWQRPELTKERFVTANIGELGHLRFYRTGDIVRQRADKAYEFLGRTDDQIKIRGHRVELGDVEAALQEIPGVLSAAAALQNANERDQRLIGFVQVDSHSELSTIDIRRYLAAKLPHYMLPQQFIQVPELLYTSAGKLDRSRMLEELGDGASEQRRLRRPTSAVERELARIWAELLESSTTDICLDDNFLDIGGHSLLALELIERARQSFDVELPLREVLYNSLEGLSRSIVSASDARRGRRNQTFFERIWRRIRGA